MEWQPLDTIPMDGTEVLIKTDTGIVSAWFCNERPTNEAQDDGRYDWICYDDMFTLDGHDNNIEAWMPIDNAGLELRGGCACSALQSRIDELEDGLRQIATWSQADQDDPSTCAMQWRGCVAIARGLLKPNKQR